MKWVYVILFLCHSWLAFGEQKYSERPHINTLTAKKYDGNVNSWSSFKDSLYAFFLQIDAIYPDSELYFLARDAEYLYDISQIIYRGTERAEQMKLINISSDVSYAPEKMKPYLEQEGMAS